MARSLGSSGAGSVGARAYRRCERRARRAAARPAPMPRLRVEQARAAIRRSCRHAVQRDRAETLAVIGQHDAERGLAQPRCLFEHRVEHRREVAGRGVDDPQHLGGRGLLLQRLGQFGGALLDALLQLGVGFLQIAGHAVELPGERFEFVAGMDLDAAVEIAGAEALGARRNRADRAGHAARQHQREQGSRRASPTTSKQRRCATPRHRAARRPR